MNIEATRIECTLDSNEASTIAYALRGNLLRAANDHWINHGKTAWEKDNGVKQELMLMEKFFSVIGRYDLYRSYYNEIAKICDGKGIA